MNETIQFTGLYDRVGSMNTKTLSKIIAIKSITKLTTLC